MLSTNYFLNPQRRVGLSMKSRLNLLLQSPFIQFGLWLGFQNIEYLYVHGDKRRVLLGRNCSTMNTIFNVISGTIRVGDNTIFAHNCMVLTGTHNFVEGTRGSLREPPIQETPTEGRDISIGAGCFLASGVIVVGKVTIGDNTIIGAGSVVSKDIPGDCFAAGVPARVVHHL